MGYTQKHFVQKLSVYLFPGKKFTRNPLRFILMSRLMYETLPLKPQIIVRYFTYQLKSFTDLCLYANTGFIKDTIAAIPYVYLRIEKAYPFYKMYAIIR